MAVEEPFLTIHPDLTKQGMRIEKAKYEMPCGLPFLKICSATAR